MNKLKVFIIICAFLSSCALLNNQHNEVVFAGLERFDKRTLLLIDNINNEVVPEILKNNYYECLKECDYLKPSAVISKADSIRMIHLRSKKAAKGYLYAMDYSYDFIVNHKDVIFVLDNDTVNTKDDVMQLVTLKKKNILIDTLIEGGHSLININTSVQSRTIK